jgi:hypothetical protein
VYALTPKRTASFFIDAIQNL